jgi:cell division protein FtsX
MAITGKEINLSQLTEELGNKALIMTFTNPTEKTITIPDDVVLSEKDLEAAIAAHVAAPEIDYVTARASALAKLAALGLSADEIASL